MKINLKFILLLIILVAFVSRFYKLDVNPPGLYIDEVAIGYNAYEILKTGKDEHGYSFPLFFKSFGDYKMPGYIYSTSVSMAFFGKNEFAVRLPSALFGFLTIPLFYFFIKKILSFDKDFSKRQVEYISLISSFLLSISSWHIHFSRGGFETNQALFLFLLALFLAVIYIEKKKLIYIILSAFLFAASIYTYHSFRIISPIFFVGLSLIFIYKNIGYRKNIIATILLFLVLCLPIFLFSLSPDGSARFSATSVFSELGHLSFFEKIVQYPFAILKNYLSYFSFYYLFDTGDGIGRHQIPEFGELFKWQLPFLLIGIYSFLKSKGKLMKLIIISMIVVAPLPASLAVPSPHSLRSLLMVLPLMFLISVGLIYFFERLRAVKLYAFLILLILASFEFIFYSHYYYVHYPQVNQRDWGAGYKEIVIGANDRGDEFDHIIVDKNLNFAPIYFKFYSDINPQMVDVTWEKPKEWKNESVLYIRPFYGSQNSEGIIYNVYLDKRNNEDIISQFWKL